MTAACPICGASWYEIEDETPCVEYTSPMPRVRIPGPRTLLVRCWRGHDFYASEIVFRSGGTSAGTSAELLGRAG